MSIARVQSKTANSGAAATTSLAVTLDSAPTSGNMLVAAVGGQGGLEFAQTGIVWTMISKQGASADLGLLAVGYVLPGASAPLTITWATATGSAIVIAEYSGTNITLDQYVSATGTGTSAASGATGTTSAANELWIGALSCRGGSASTFSSPTNSFSIVGQDKSTIGTTGDRSACLLERFVSSTGNANAGATLSNLIWTAQALTFREIVASGGISRGRAA